MTTTAMEGQIKELETFLSSQGMRLTATRRQTIAEALAFKESFTAEQLCKVVRKRHKGVSRATVYRTLKLMVEFGALKAIDTGTGTLCFLSQFSRQVPVAELVCVDCGRVEVIDAPFMQWYAQSAAQKGQLQAIEGRLQVKGECLRLKAGQCPHSPHNKRSA